MDEASPQYAILCAVIDRIIPADDFPAASEAGVGNYIQRQLHGDVHEHAISINAGLHALQIEAKYRFNQSLTTLSPAQLDSLLVDVETGAVSTSWPTDPAVFFATLVNLVNEGYYSDPDNGGNREALSWRMVGYSPFPRQHSGSQFEQETQ